MKNKYTKEQIQIVKDELNIAAMDYIRDGMTCSDINTFQEFYAFALGVVDDVKILKQINNPKTNIKILEKHVRDMLGYASIKELLENC